MKKVLGAITVALSALIATSAMADWDHGRDRDHRPPSVQEKIEWQEGVVLPYRYHDNRYYVNDYRSYKNLHKPARFERWYKVDGRYVLVNERTHHVIRVVR